MQHHLDEVPGAGRHRPDRAHIGRVGEADPCLRSDDELVDLVHDELRAKLGVTSQPPTMARADRWPEAIPQYDVGHKDRVALIKARLTRLPGLAVAGATYRGIGIPDCISSGDEAAEAVLAPSRHHRRAGGLTPGRASAVLTGGG